MQSFNICWNDSVLCLRWFRLLTFAHVFRYSRSHAHARRHRRVACAACNHPFSPFSHCNRIVSIINEPRLGLSCLSLSFSLSPTLIYIHVQRTIYTLLPSSLRIQQCAGHAVVYPCCWLIHVWENLQRRNGRRKFPSAVTKERDTRTYICTYSTVQKS